MEPAQPSRTAWAAAAHRAAHQLLEGGRLFSDPLALRMLGPGAEDRLRNTDDHPARRAMRIFIAARTRFAEDSLASAVAGGVRQLVILGAGLDSFAYRSPYGERLQIFEVDHPATQAWKRQRLDEASIAVPPYLTFLPVDFENTSLAQALASSKLEPSLPTFFTWLGVVPYLTREAIWSTLAAIGSHPAPAHVVFDYGNPPESLSPEMRRAHEVRAARVASVGEAWLTFFHAHELHPKLAALGFPQREDLGPREIAARYFPDRLPHVPEHGGHVLRAGTATANTRDSEQR